MLDAEVVLMVCDKPGAKVVERAAAHGVGAFVFAPKQYASKADYEREIVARLDAAGVELVCLAGYMRIVGDVLLGAYGGRIINIHPSLLPDVPFLYGCLSSIPDISYSSPKVYSVSSQTVRYGTSYAAWCDKPHPGFPY